MKVILSRKGFDGTYGGCPSPILPDGTMVSMPIPSESDDCTYDELKFPGGGSYYDAWKALKSGGYKEYSCHLDPDIRRGIRRECNGWKPAFGQCDAAQGHLINHEVGVGDLFLFFGWFRKTERADGRLQYVKGAPGIHAIYGYLQVGGILTDDAVRKCPWHPHSQYINKNNTIYVASDALVIDGKDCSLPGAGTLKFSEDLNLTAPGQSHSRWKLIDVLKDKSIVLSYHDKSKCIKDDYFQSAARGQEFVYDENAVVSEWATKLITTNYEDAL